MGTIEDLKRLLARCERNLETAKARFERTGTATDAYLVTCAQKRVDDYRKQVERRERDGAH